MKLRLTLGLGLALLFSPAPAWSQSNKKADTGSQHKSFSPKEEARLKHEIAAGKRRDQRDRRDYVRAAPTDFKPEDAAKRIKLTLILESPMLRKGKRFRYRAELQNIGNKPVSFFETSSFFKSGALARKFHLHLTSPDGKTQELRARDVRDAPGGGEVRLPGSERMSPKQRDEAITRLNEDAQHEFELGATLTPGESLVSRDYQNSSFGSFREPAASFEFESVGTYRLQLIFEDFPSPPDYEETKRLEDLEKDMKKVGFEKSKVFQSIKARKAHILSHAEKKRAHAEQISRSWGRVESNVVQLEVTP